MNIPYADWPRCGTLHAPAAVGPPVGAAGGGRGAAVLHFLQPLTRCRSACCHSQFGDGIMSAIDFYFTVGKMVGTKGEDRVVITMNGKLSALLAVWLVPTASYKCDGPGGVMLWHSHSSVAAAYHHASGQTANTWLCAPYVLTPMSAWSAPT